MHWLRVSVGPYLSAVQVACIDALPVVALADDTAGAATVETYTIVFDRNGRKKGIVIARNNMGERILAHISNDDATLQVMLSEDPAGREGQIRIVNGENIFEFA